MILDHAFILCSAGAPEAAALVRVGLTEGAPNEHPGQGTACRRFFFSNAYLELVWVSNADEARADPARPTRLWERWSGRGREACPFGVVFRPDAGAVDRDPPFETWSYHPRYLPAGLAIELAVGTPLREPELFYLCFTRAPEQVSRQPIHHAIPLRRLDDVTVGLPGTDPLSDAARSAAAASSLSFHSAADYLMVLAFDGGGAGETVDLRPTLPLVLSW